jgi:hypothetical protein
LTKPVFFRSPFALLPFLLLLGWKFLFFSLYQFKIEDLWHQQQLAVHLAHGYGPGYLYATAADVSQWYSEVLFKWPPLFSVLLAGLLRLTIPVGTATLLLAFVALLLLLSSIRSLVRQLQLSPAAQWLLWVLLLLNPVLTDLFSVTDLLSLGLWLTGLSLLMQVLLAGRKVPVVFLSVLLFLPAAFRYQYYPLILVLPVCVFLMGIMNRNKQLWKLGLLLTGGVLFFLLLQVVILNYYAGGGAYLADVPGGSAKNLSRMTPFFLYSFAPVYLPVNLFAERAAYDVQHLYRLASLISLLLFVLFLVLLLRHPATGRQQVFRFMAVSSIAFLFVYLSGLSLLFREQINGNSTFTYVQEPRYWGLALVLLPLLFALWMDAGFRSLLPQAALLALLINLPPLAYRLYKTINDPAHPARYTNRTAFKIQTDRLIRQNTAAYRKPVVLSCFDSDFALFNYSSPYAIASYDSLLNRGRIYASRPVWFYLITRDTLRPGEEQFIRNNSLQQKLREPGLYRLYVQPVR